MVVFEPIPLEELLLFYNKISKSIEVTGMDTDYVQVDLVQTLKEKNNDVNFIC